MRDVAYGQVPKGRRAQLHVRFSDWVTVLRGKADEFVEIVAWHLEQACRLSREVARSPIEPPLLQAAGALAKAAGRAERREGLREAAPLLHARRSTCSATSIPTCELELRLRRADIMMMLGELKDACDELEEVAEAASALERTDVECEALLLLGDIDQRQGRAADAHERLAEAQELVAGHRATPFSVARWRSCSPHSSPTSRASTTRRSRACAPAIATAEEIDDWRSLAEGHLRLAAILMNRGELARRRPSCAAA